MSGVLKADPDALDRSFRRLVRVANLLREECGILDGELVPYELQAVLLASTLSDEPDPGLRTLLADWFWVTTYGELFAGLSGYRLGLVVKSVRELVNHRKMTWSGPSPFRIRPLPVTSDFRAVRIKALALQLARSQALHLSSEPDPFRVLAEYKRAALFQLVPRRLLTKANFSSPANRFLCAPDQALTLRSQILTGNVSDEIAAAHLIPSEGKGAAIGNSWDEFVTFRLDTMAAIESKFINEIVIRNPNLRAPESSEVGELFEFGATDN